MARLKLNPDFVEKICPTCQKSFKVSFYLRNRKIHCSKKCSNHDPLVIEKMLKSQQKTFNEKYKKHPMKLDITKQKLQKTINEKYGVNWISQSDGWYKKVMETKLKKYGNPNFTNSEKRKQTFKNIYGVENPNQIPSIHAAILQTRKNKHYNYLIEYCNSESLEVLFSKEEYRGNDYSNKYPFKCKKCGYIFETSLYNHFGSVFCEKCNPNRKETLETKFFDFLTSILPSTIIKRKDRTILYGKELDFYIPEKKIAFELNGLYWHSECGGGHKKHYHLNKTKACLSHGIRLIHIFENEIINKRSIVESIVKTILKIKPSTILYARNCILKEVNSSEKNLFLEQNHLQGKDASTIKIGLYHNEKLVSIMTFRKKGRFNNNFEWELSRFCNLKDTIIIGGASKLFSYFIKTYNPSSIISYCDRRYFSGDLYLNLGFSFIGNSSPAYHYITPDYKELINRLNFQKHLLKKKLTFFNPSFSEWENMKANGFDRIWDCGHSKWAWKSK